MKKLHLFLLCMSVNLLAMAQVTGNWKVTGKTDYPINTIWQINGIGRTSQFKFHPTNSAKMYAVVANGGLWVSNDTANTWTNTGTDNNLPPTQVASVCIDFTNDQILYLGTGDLDYYSSGYGVYKSLDGGTTWNRSNTGMGNCLVVEIIMDPLNRNVLIAATNKGIYKSSNAGASWQLKKNVQDFNDLDLKPSPKTRTLYATTMNAFFVSKDMGETWNQTPLNGLGISGGGKAAVTKADSNIVYLGFVGDDTYHSAILKSTDGGASFSTRKPGSDKNLNSYEQDFTTDAVYRGQGRYNYDMNVDPVNPNKLYLVSHVYHTSEDGGLTWVNYFPWSRMLHTDMHKIEVSPYNHNKLFCVNDGGTYVSTDKGVTWTPKTNGMAILESRYAAQSPTSRDTFYVGSQDNGGLYLQGNTWYTNTGGDENSFMAVDYKKTAKVYYSRGESKIFGDYQNGLNFPFNGDNHYQIVFSPTQTDIAYVGGPDGVYRSTNVTSSLPVWNKLAGLTKRIKTLVVSPTQSFVLYAIADDNTIYRCDNTAATSPFFRQLTAPASSISGIYRASITLVKSNANLVYVTIGSKVYRSPDKGLTWKDLSAGLLPVDIIKIVNDQSSADESMYLATGLGVYYIKGAWSMWQPYAKNLPTICNISDLTIFSRNDKSLLRVAFGGRGIWESDLYQTLSTNTPPTVSITSPSGNATVPSPVTFTANAADADGSVDKVDYYYGSTLIGSATSAPFTVVWNASLPGTYRVNAVATDNRGIEASSATIEINVTVSDKLPVVTLTSPSGGTTYMAPARIELRATATDASGISKVEFFEGTRLLQTVTSAPYQFNWQDVAAGSYTLSAKATNVLNKSSVSTSVAVTVAPAPQGDILGPDCGTAGALLNFELSPANNVNAAYYNWYYEGGGQVSQPNNAYKTVLTSANPFSPGRICINVNYKDYSFRQFCKTIPVCPSPRMAPVDALTALDEPAEASARVMVFPNPARNLINVAIESSDNANVKITLSDDLNHQMLEKAVSVQTGRNNLELDVTSIQNGTYTLVISKGSSVVVKRIAIAK